jgi:hypothetical protein
MYQSVINGVIRLSDGLVIPFAIDSPEKTEYEAWVAQGNTPRPNPPSGHHKWDDVNKLWYADSEVTEKLTDDTANSEDAKLAEIDSLLPSWAQVESYLDGLANLADVKVALKKIARVVYRLAKHTSK